MKNIICIGECSLNIALGTDGRPVGSMPGGRIVNAAAILASAGFGTVMASEAAADPVGDIVARYLEEKGVVTASLDRFTEGRTPLNIFTEPGDGSQASITRYERYPEECFDIIWPRVEDGDIVIFGGHYAIDARMRPRLARFLSHCAERKAVLVYLPGFLPQQEPRITRVMPEILENLELADMVVARCSDLAFIFGSRTPEEAYKDHIDFYCRSLLCVDSAQSRLCYISAAGQSELAAPSETSRTMLWNAGALAGAVKALVAAGICREDLEKPSDELRESVLAESLATAEATANALAHSWQLIF